MSKRLLIGLLAVSVLAMWGSAANAFNRINGIIIKHGSIVADVRLCGDPLVNTELILNLEVEVEIACANPGGHVPNGNPGHPIFNLTFGETKTVKTGDIGDFDSTDACISGNNNNATATISFEFDLPPEVKCKKKWTKVPDSELFTVAAMATWNCTGLGPECQNPGDQIEAISVECADVPPEEGGVACDDNADHIGPAGAPPPPLAAVAFFDFQDWVAENGEQGFDNSMPFTDTVDELTLTAKAFDSVSTAIHVYMDGLSGPSIGGMGVCSDLSVTNLCSPSSDDSISDDEELHWEFSHDITEVTLELGNGDHGDYSFRPFDYQYGAQGWLTARTDRSGVRTLVFDGSSDQLMFRTKSAVADKQFYIRNAVVMYKQ